MGKSHRLTKRELVKQLTLVANELKQCVKEGSLGSDSKVKLVSTEAAADPTKQEICDALFDVANATQAAIIANGCAGV